MSRRLYIGNLPRSATEEELRSKFGRVGTVESVSIATDASTGISKRFGFVEMGNAAEAKAAVTRLNMTQYDDATMSVSVARPDQ